MHFLLTMSLLLCSSISVYSMQIAKLTKNTPISRHFSTTQDQFFPQFHKDITQKDYKKLYALIKKQQAIPPATANWCKHALQTEKQQKLEQLKTHRELSWNIKKGFAKTAICLPALLPAYINTLVAICSIPGSSEIITDSAYALGSLGVTGLIALFAVCGPVQFWNAAAHPHYIPRKKWPVRCDALLLSLAERELKKKIDSNTVLSLKQ